MSIKQFRPSKRIFTIVATVMTAGAVALGAGALSAANAADGMRVSATAPTVEEAMARAQAECSAHGYNALVNANSSSGGNGPVTVSGTCAHV